MQQCTGCTAHIMYSEVLNMLTIFIYYFLIVAAASIPVRVAYAIWFRTPMAVDLSEVIINAVMLAAVIKTRGNVVQIFKVSRSKHGD
jgi:hypothetical protein